MKEGWTAALRQGAQDALVIFGPGAEDPLVPGVERRHVPAHTCIPLAEGARLADPDRRVLVVTGDADVYTGGLGSLLHALRRNLPITCVVADNGVAAGQVARNGPAAFPMQPLALALAAGASFVAQALAGDQTMLPYLVNESRQHQGFALINVRDDVVALNLGEVEDYDPHNAAHARDKGADPERVYTGVIYHEPERPSLEQMLHGRFQPRSEPLSPAAWEQVVYGEHEREVYPC